MSFALKNLRRIAHGGAVASGSPVGIFHLATNDLISDIEGANYLNAAASYVQKGDILLVTADLDGTPKYKQYQFTTVDIDTPSVVITAEVGAPVTAAAAARAAIQSLQFAVNLADIANGDLMTSWVPGFNGKVLSMHAFALKAATTAAKAADLNLEIGTTNLTGGVLGLTSANMTPQGAKVDASAITAANVFTNTDALSLEAANVTAFAEGVGLIVVMVENTDLLNSLQA